MKMYKVFYPRSEKTTFTFFMENDKLKKPEYTETLYKTLHNSDDFDVIVFMKEMASHIPSFFGFDDANAFMDSFIAHLEEMPVEAIEEIIAIYKKNSQCTGT